MIFDLCDQKSQTHNQYLMMSGLTRHTCSSNFVKIGPAVIGVKTLVFRLMPPCGQTRNRIAQNFERNSCVVKLPWLPFHQI